MSESLLMLTLPNSGSTWLADLIARHTRWNRYSMEYFNPIRNAANFNTLSRHFGCELLSCYRNIAKTGGPGIHSAIRETWGQDVYNFTKEVFSPAKLPVFVQHFRCFVLLRSAADTFPPKRARVWSFYEHSWQAMHDAGDELVGEHFEDKALIAHLHMQERLQSDAQALGVPVINYRELFDDSQLQGKMEAAIGECDGRLLGAIRESRRLVER